MPRSSVREPKYGDGHFVDRKHVALKRLGVPCQACVGSGIGHVPPSRCRSFTFRLPVEALADLVSTGSRQGQPGGSVHLNRLLRVAWIKLPCRNQMGDIE